MKVRKYEKHLPWMNQWTKNANEDALGVTSRKAANTPSDAYDISEGIQIIEVRIRATSGTGADGKSGTLHCYLARKDGDISYAGSIAITVGQQIATLNVANYVDTMVPTDRWITEIHLADENGNNGMSRIAIDTIGYDIIFFRLEYAGDTVWYIDVSGCTS